MTGQEIASLQGHLEPIRDAGFDASNSIIALLDAGNQVKIWDAETGDALSVMPSINRGIMLNQGNQLVLEANQ